MGNKNIIIIVFFIALLSIVYFLGKEESESTDSINKKILNITGTIKKIKITKNKTSVTLFQDKENWLIKEKNNYPANLEKIKEVIEQLTKVKGDTFYTDNPDKHSKFELEDPDKSEDSKGAVKIEIMDNTGKIIDGIIIGKSKNSKKQSDTPWATESSVFARNLNSNTVYLCNTSVSADNAPSNWLKKEFLDIKKNEFRSVTI